MGNPEAHGPPAPESELPLGLPQPKLVVILEATPPAALEPTQEENQLLDQTHEEKELKREPQEATCGPQQPHGPQEIDQQGARSSSGRRRASLSEAGGARRRAGLWALNQSTSQ